MYNLLVTAAEGAWDISAYEYDRTRFLEYTTDSLKAKFAKLDANALEELKSLPTLFTYEGDDEIARVGYIRTIRERGRSILIEYEFDESIPTFLFSQLKSLEIKLDIQGWEMSRTHWAVKDEDLFELLASVGLVDSSYVGEGRPPGRVEEMQFRVALSFPGEKREYVAAVAAEVKKRRGAMQFFTIRTSPPSLPVPTWILCYSASISTTRTWSSFFSAQSTRARNGVGWNGVRSATSSRIKTITRSCLCASITPI